MVFQARAAGKGKFCENCTKQLAIFFAAEYSIRIQKNLSAGHRQVSIQSEELFFYSLHLIKRYSVNGKTAADGMKWPEGAKEAL